MAKDRSKRSSSDETDAVKRKKEKKSKKRKVEEETEQEVPEVLIKPKKLKKHKKKHAEDTNLKTVVEDQQEMTEPSSPPAEALEHDDSGGEDVSVEEQRVLERKLKKLRNKEEKAKLRAEGKTVEKVVPEKVLPSQLALDYLTCWTENRKAWKFQKLRQTWLLKNMFSAEEVPDESFASLLLYIEGLQGTARSVTVEKSEALVKSLGDGPWEKEEKQKMQRAREVLQLLS